VVVPAHLAIPYAPVYTPASLGAWTVVQQAQNSADFQQDTLGAALEEDVEAVERYAETILGILVGGSQKQAAVLLGRSRGAVQSRVKRLADLSGLRLSVPEEHFRLVLAAMSWYFDRYGRTPMP
jgi:hypothetical protein